MESNEQGKSKVAATRSNEEFTPELILSISKHHCFFQLFLVKLREIFKERYNLETNKKYKDTPIHGDFIIQMLGNDIFNSFNADDKAVLKSGIVNKWRYKLLFILLLSYKYKRVPIDRLNKENKIIERLKFIENHDNVKACECHSNLEELEKYEDELTELYISLGGKQSDIDNAVYNSFSNGIIGFGGTGDCSNNIKSIAIKEKADELFNQGLYDQAIDEYQHSLSMYECEDYNYINGFSLLSCTILKRLYCEFKLICKENNERKVNEINIENEDVFINNLIKYCTYSTYLTPSYSQAWFRKSYFFSRLGTYDGMRFAIKYLEVALLLDPNNNEYFEFKSKLEDDCEKINEMNMYYFFLNKETDVSESIVFLCLQASHTKENEFKIPSVFQDEFKELKVKNGSNKSSLEYYDDGMEFKSSGEYQISFKSFCFSILAGGNVDFNVYVLSSYYQLGLMYAYDKDRELLDNPTTINHNGRIGAMFQLAKIYFNYNNKETTANGCKYYKSTEIALYWLRRICKINRVDEKNISTQSPSIITMDEEGIITKSLLALGSILFTIDENEFKDTRCGKSNLVNIKDEALSVLSKGYSIFKSLEFLKVIEKYNPSEAIKLKSNNHDQNHQQCGCAMGKTIFQIEYEYHFKNVKLDYNMIKKFAQHSSSPSIQSQRIIECLDFVNLFLHHFKSSKSQKAIDKSIEHLANAFLCNEFYIIKLPENIIQKLNSYLSKSIKQSNELISKELSIVWIGFNIYNIGFKEDDFIKRKEKMVEFISKSIKRFPNDLIFKFFSSIFNRYLGKLDIALNYLNGCIKLSNELSSSTSSNNDIKSKSSTSSDIYYFYKAETLFHLNRHQESIECYYEYLNKSPSDARWRMESYYTIAHLKHDPNNPIENELNLKIAKESESNSLYCFLPWSASKFKLSK